MHKHNDYNEPMTAMYCVTIAKVHTQTIAAQSDVCQQVAMPQTLSMYAQCMAQGSHCSQLCLQERSLMQINTGTRGFLSFVSKLFEDVSPQGQFSLRNMHGY